MFGGPVLVVNTWVIAHDRLAAFMEVLANVRVARLTTGAYRWNLYRNVDEPHRVSEIFAVSSWDEHLRQHRRIDGAAAELIRQAREFDVAGGPASHHLVAFEVADPARRPDWQDLLVQHEEAHRIDGSIPLGDDDPVRARDGLTAATAPVTDRERAVAWREERITVGAWKSHSTSTSCGVRATCWLPPQATARSMFR